MHFLSSRDCRMNGGLVIEISRVLWQMPLHFSCHPQLLHRCILFEGGDGVVRKNSNLSFNALLDL